jgi:hypothetical protein
VKPDTEICLLDISEVGRLVFTSLLFPLQSKIATRIKPHAAL